MADPTRYIPGFNYSGWEADHPTEPKPGAELDNDFALIRHSIDETIRALRDVRRSDGKVQNAAVDFDALSPAVKAAIAGSEFDYEVIEDLLAKDANLQDLPDKAEAVVNLGAVARAGNLSDLDDPAAAVANIGALAAASNLADITDAEAARNNLGLGDFTYIKRTVPLNLAEEGVDFADDAAGATDQTAEIQAAIGKANAEMREIISPGGYVRTHGLLLDHPAMGFHFIGNPVDETILVGTQTLSDAGGTILEVNHTAVEIAPGEMQLAADVLPNQDRIQLSGAGNLQPGMVIQWASDQEWPHDGRGRWMRGEVHRITRALGGGSFEIDGATWDFYDISEETITVRAWWPGRVTLAGLALEMPPPTTGLSGQGLRIGRMLNPVVDGLRAEGMTSSGVWFRQNWRGDYRNVRLARIGRDGAVGYGVSMSGEVGSRLTGLEGRACRRVVDLGSLNDTESAPARLVTVRDFLCDGSGAEPLGDEFWPHGSVPNFGVGTHGPAEQCKFVNGQITNVRDGVTLRGRDLEVRGITFRGNLEKCIQGSYGTGLVVDGCVYEKNDYPRKQEGATQAAVFLQFGGDTDFGPWDYAKASVVQNCVVNGLSDAFVRFASTRDVQNLTVRGNTVLLRPAMGQSAYMYDAPNGTVEIRSASLGPNTLGRLSGNGAVHTFHPDIVAGHVEALDDGVDMGDGRYMFAVPDDTAVRIRSAGHSGRVNVNLCSDIGEVRGVFQIVQGATTPVDLGSVGSSVAGSNAGTLTGTTGNDGDFTLSLTPGGDLFVENRTGATRQVVLHAT